MTAILAGIRIIDLTSGLPGPVASLLLAEAGADVVKVEPQGGDPMRGTAAFATWNRSKRSIVINLEEQAGRTDLDSLLAGADVLLHELTPAAALRLGLDDGALSARFPHLIAASVTGYPCDSPDAERRGIDILVQARSGIMAEQRSRDRPIFYRFPLPSWGAAYLTAIGILTRLIVRERSSHVGPVHTSLYQGALVSLSKKWSQGQIRRPSMSIARLAWGPVPFGPFQSSDGRWIQMVPAASGTPVFQVPGIKAVVDEMGLDPPDDPEAILIVAFARHTAEGMLAALWGSGVPAVPALDVGEVLRDKQAQLNGYVIEVDDPDWGTTYQAGTPFTTIPSSGVRGPAPRLGADTATVLAEAATWRPRPVGDDATPPAARAPLAGLKVLDFGMFLAGPYAPMLLADLGADVIKVEPPTGDRMRNAEQLFLGCQRGKRSLALDLTRAESRPILERLIQWADVVHHNLRLPAARRLGIDYECVRAVNPKAIYCHVSAFGPRGPRTDWPGIDPTGQALSGWQVAAVGPGDQPMYHSFAMADDQAALASLVGTLLALYQRDRTGTATPVTASLLGAATLMTSETLLVAATDTLAPIPRIDSRQTGISPWYRIYEAADGWIAVAAVDDQQRIGFLEAFEAFEAHDAGALERAVRTMPASAALKRLAAADVPAEAVETDGAAAFFAAPHHWAGGLAVSYDHSEYGHLKQVGALWDFGDRPLRIERPPPTIGQHSAAILSELGSAVNDLIGTRLSE